MSNQSPFVKIVIWFMIFLMSIGFAALVIAPFMQSSSLFGDSSGRGATEELVAEARADIKKDACTDEKDPPTGARLERCQDAFTRLASSYQTLAIPDEGATEAPRDSKRNIERAGDAWRALYELDTTNEESAARWAGYLRDTGKAAQALKIWTVLVKANPDDEDFLLQQAGAYQQSGDTAKAIATLRLFTKRFPDSGQVEQIQEEIKTLQKQQAEQAAGGGQQLPAGLG